MPLNSTIHQEATPDKTSPSPITDIVLFKKIPSNLVSQSNANFSNFWFWPTDCLFGHSSHSTQVNRNFDTIQEMLVDNKNEI